MQQKWVEERMDVTVPARNNGYTIWENTATPVTLRATHGVAEVVEGV